ncbi:diaminopimelate epimerase [Galliscardovia ingluviei]|uniref:Diaminopimelate epimerase n=1 Tax=Galliscardovia ingluviei TaxID=1769422 RepID=A0A8J3EW49_9BIFI|nr:diaminopimelate epimerase [Galliscardovia ingluviei]GGI13700.1 diaminopimelate epimerase [Galliscardovia ingluviei]
MTIASTVMKGHGTGNDFIVYADPNGEYNPTVEEVQQLCDRHFGIGADGVLRLTRPEYVDHIDKNIAQALQDAQVQWVMDYRNADGSIAQMCGNGTRVSALFLHTQGLSPQGPIALGTRAGVKVLTPRGAVSGLGEHVYTVAMGQWHASSAAEHQISVHQGSVFDGRYVDMGNPHIVTVLNTDTNQWQRAEQTLRELDLSVAPQVTPGLEEGQNVEFVAVEAPGLASMRVHERGVGETLSCGTGLCASAITLRAQTGIDSWKIRILGGTVQVDVDEHNVSLTGDAQLVASVTLL